MSLMPFSIQRPRGSSRSTRDIHALKPFSGVVLIARGQEHGRYPVPLFFIFSLFNIQAPPRYPAKICAIVPRWRIDRLPSRTQAHNARCNLPARFTQGLRPGAFHDAEALCIIFRLSSSCFSGAGSRSMSVERTCDRGKERPLISLYRALSSLTSKGRLSAPLWPPHKKPLSAQVELSFVYSAEAN